MGSEALGYYLEDLTHLVSFGCEVQAGAMLDMFLDEDGIRLCVAQGSCHALGPVVHLPRRCVVHAICLNSCCRGSRQDADA